LEDLKQEIKDLEKELRELRKIARKEGQGKVCLDCGVTTTQQRQRMGVGETMVGMMPWVSQLGLGLMNMSMYKHGVNAQSNNINAYYNAYNNGVNQFYGQTGAYYNQCANAGIP